MRVPTFGQFQREASTISLEFEKMSVLQEQSESGLKILHSSDDPVLASQIKPSEDFISTLQGYFDNSQLAKTRADLFGTTMKSVASQVGCIQTLIKKAEDGTLSDTNRASIAQQLEGYLSSFSSAVNTTDASGRYIYSGKATNIAPYLLSGGKYTYQGSDSSVIDIGQRATAIYNQSGDEIFGNMPTGNGTYTITANSANTGSATTTSGTVDGVNYIADNYTVTFVTNSNGQTAYQVIGTNGGQVVPAPPLTTPADAPVFDPNNGITFNGVSFNIVGKPNVGDNFQVQPSTTTNVLDSLQSLITLLNTPTSGAGSITLPFFNQSLTQIEATFTQISNSLNGSLSAAGTRASVVDAQLTSNNDVLTTERVSLKSLQEADPFQITSALAQQSLILQVTQESYMKMQETLTKLISMQL